MNDSAAQIERIVRQVLAELAAQGAVPVAEPQSKGKAEPVENRCVIAERVVTLATLDGRLNGAATLLVPRGAVVTPAVRDELKAKKIRLEFADTAKAATAVANAVLPTLYLGIADVADDVNAAMAAARSDLKNLALLQSLQHADLPELVRRLCDAVASGGSSESAALGVILTRRPALAACLANRLPNIRCVWACHVAALDEALSTAAPNVIAFDPAKAARHGRRAFLQAFVRGGGKACPSEFQAFEERR